MSLTISPATLPDISGLGFSRFGWVCSRFLAKEGICIGSLGAGSIFEGHLKTFW